jgi:segregation and condensation protein B
MLEHKQIKRIFEGALMAAEGEPLPLSRLKQIMPDNDIENNELREIINELVGDYRGHGIELKEVASGFRFQVCADLCQWISKLWEERAPRYSRALLETLALIAYRQPITRAEIEDVRGVSLSSNIIRTLFERQWIKVAGHKDMPGKPALLVTTNEFLDYFNLKSIKELPTLKELSDLDQAALQLELSLNSETRED